MKKVTLPLSILLVIPMVVLAGGNGGLLPKNAVPAPKAESSQTQMNSSTQKQVAPAPMTKETTTPTTKTKINAMQQESNTINNQEIQRRARFTLIDRNQITSSSDLAKAEQQKAQNKLLRYRSFLK